MSFTKNMTFTDKEFSQEPGNQTVMDVKVQLFKLHFLQFDLWHDSYFSPYLATKISMQSTFFNKLLWTLASQ